MSSLADDAEIVDARRRLKAARDAVDSAGRNYTERRRSPGTKPITIDRARSEWGTAVFEWADALTSLARIEDSRRVPPRFNPADGLPR